MRTKEHFQKREQQNILHNGKTNKPENVFILGNMEIRQRRRKCPLCKQILNVFLNLLNWTVFCVCKQIQNILTITIIK